jgi:glucose-fructose oxidoreductase
VSRNPQRRKIRYAVVGLGSIAQVAVLPAFRRARKNCELTALVSGDERKRGALGRKYGVSTVLDYEELPELLRSGEIDAVYIALPNHMHRDHAVAAARAGIHVLCEKPMAVTEQDCLDMIEAARAGDARLMIAYRLHLERSNLTAVDHVRAGRLGDVRLFQSVFTMQVQPGNVRLEPIANGGGTLYDIGIYCINAARHFFGSEPTEVLAASVADTDKRFRQCDEMTAAVLRFPGGRLASFISSFGAVDEGSYEIFGTKGELRARNAYYYSRPITHELTIEGKTQRRRFARRDQFAAELMYFSDCIRNGREPEPSGHDGLADVRVIRALYESARKRSPVRIAPVEAFPRPRIHREIPRPPGGDPGRINARAPSRRN